jgi:hypothetical protein
MQNQQQVRVAVVDHKTHCKTTEFCSKWEDGSNVCQHSERTLIRLGTFSVTLDRKEGTSRKTEGGRERGVPFS